MDNSITTKKSSIRMWDYDILLFDADRTLLDFDKSELMALKQVFEEYGIEFNDERHCKYSKINHDLWNQHELGLISRDRLIYKRFEDFFAGSASDGLPDEVAPLCHSVEYRACFCEAQARQLAPCNSAISALTPASSSSSVSIFSKFACIVVPFVGRQCPPVDN